MHVCAPTVMVMSMSNINIYYSYIYTYRAGLQPGDVVTHVNGREIKSAGDVYDALERTPVLNLVVHRGQKK